MKGPPPGYDDESVVPQNRLKFLLGQFEDELSKIESVFRQHVPGQFEAPTHSMEHAFEQLRASAEELGSDYRFLIDRLITDYENFRDEPSQEQLEKLFGDVKSLQLLLIG